MPAFGLLRSERAATAIGAGLAVLAMAIVGSSVAVSAELTHYPVFTGQAGRYAIAAVALALLARGQPGARARELTTGEHVRLLLLAVTGLVGFNVCLIDGSRHADPSTIGVVIGATPLVLAVAGPLLERRRPRVRVVAAAAVVVGGVALVEGLGRTTFVGGCYAVGALLGEVLFSLLAAALLPRLGPIRLSAYVCTLAVPLLIACALVRTEAPRWPTERETLALGWMAAMVTVVAFLAWYYALGHLGVERAAGFPGLISVSALVGAALLGTGHPHAIEAVGAVLVTVGVATGVSARRRDPVTVPT